MKKIFKNICSIVLSIILVIVAIFAYDKFLDKQIELDYNPIIGRTVYIDEVNKGTKILKQNALKNDLMLFGSSELYKAEKISQHPANMFPNNYLNSNITIIGNAYVQSLLHSIKFAAISDELKNKNIVFIVSLQWFKDPEINENGFKSNFSELQFYEAMDNKNLDKKIKQYFCDRIAKLVKNELSLSRVYVYAKLSQKTDLFSKLIFKLLSPYYAVRKKFLSLKDKHDSYKVVKKFKNHDTPNSKQINWQNEETIAYQTGQRESVEFDHEMQKIYSKKSEEWYRNVDLLASKELEDYKIFLKICHELEIKPYIIFAPTNGIYYDFEKLDCKKRLKFYDELESIASSYGFDYLDMHEMEYEPYILIDNMHLGWRGWLYVDKKITEYFSQV